MRGKVLSVFTAVILTAFFVGAQIRRPPSDCDCPAQGSIGCFIAQTACDECWDACEDAPGTFRRVTPTERIDYELPRLVGVTQLSYELDWVTWRNGVHPHALWTTTELLDDISSHGIRAVKIWLDGDPLDGGRWCWSPDWWTPPDWWPEDQPEFSCQFGEFWYEDMADVWGHPGIDVYTMRFQNEAWSAREYGANQNPFTPPVLSGITFASEPTYHIARELLARFGHLDKTIIFGDWEQDWAIQGQGCRGEDTVGRWLFPWDDAPSRYTTECIPDCIEHISDGGDWRPPICTDFGRCYDDNPHRECFEECGSQIVYARLAYVRGLIERRQRAIEAARAEFPDAQLRILHAVTVNRYPGNFEESDLGIALVEEISTLDPQPDLIGLSFWQRDIPITDALDYIEAETGYSRDRIFIDEFGAWRESWQYERIFVEGRRARCWGVNLMNVWMWRQTWWGEVLNDGSVRGDHGLFYQTNVADHEPDESVIFGDPRPGYFAVQDLISFVPNEQDCEVIMNLPATNEGDFELHPSPTPTPTPTPTFTPTPEPTPTPLPMPTLTPTPKPRLPPRAFP